MVYGGSHVFDPEMGGDEDWPHRLGRLLGEAPGWRNVEAINAGIPGHASFDSLGRLFAEGHAFEPDYVLLCGQWNDIKRFQEQDPLLRSLQPYRATDDPLRTYQGGVDRWLCEWSQLYTKLRQRYYEGSLRIGSQGAAPPRALRTGDAIRPEAVRQYRLAVETFVDLARNARAVPILVLEARLPGERSSADDRRRINYHYVGLTHEGLLEAFRITDEVLEDVARRKGVVLLRSARPISGQPENFVDEIHLSRAGSTRLAVALAEELAALKAPAGTRAFDVRATIQR
jgi:hypothetical protein